MSALGQKRTHALQQRMSALGQKRTFDMPAQDLPAMQASSALAPRDHLGHRGCRAIHISQNDYSPGLQSARPAYRLPLPRRQNRGLAVEIQEAAWVLGRKLGLKESSLRVWFNQWKREDKASKKLKPVTKPVATI